MQEGEAPPMSLDDVAGASEVLNHRGHRAMRFIPGENGVNYYDERDVTWLMKRQLIITAQVVFQLFWAQVEIVTLLQAAEATPPYDYPATFAIHGVT